MVPCAEQSSLKELKPMSKSVVIGAFRRMRRGPSETGLRMRDRGRGWKKFLHILPFNGLVVKKSRLVIEK